jgi:hypothetical protein
MVAVDRAALLRAQTAVTGIDFVFVDPSQTVLDVHFLTDPGGVVPTFANVVLGGVRITPVAGYDGLPDVPIVQWDWVPNTNILRIVLAEPGGFADYVLHLDDDRVDRYFNHVRFSFKAACPSSLDCAPDDPECPVDDGVDAVVDYQARDFWSFRRALLDFAAGRHPDWKDGGLVPDIGVMLVEVMSALGDELAYYQDRVAREAYLETATERRSVRRLARLVDYPVHDGIAPSTWLDVTVASGTGSIPAGADVRAIGDAGVVRAHYEVGRGLDEVVDGTTTYGVAAACNRFVAHVWDEGATCLPAGATELFIAGSHRNDLLPNTGPPDRWVLLRTVPVDPTVEARQIMVRLVEAEDDTDTVQNLPVTRIRWDPAQATTCDLDLEVLEVRANLVPVTPGRTEVRRFTIGPVTAPVDPPSAIERDGANRSITYLFSLPGTEDEGLVWLGVDPVVARPEVDVREVGGGPWRWRRSFVGVASSQAEDPDFTLDDGTWRRVVGYRRNGGETVHTDYATGAGVTVRFGDGRFGRAPATGTVFEVTYRVGNGRNADVAADSLTGFDAIALPFVKAVTNPFAATGGIDPQPIAEVRQLAPEAFRALTYRAVRPEDYAEAAERLPWVQRAGADFRWTGSWLTAFATPDPLGAAVLAEGRRQELEAQLDRFRQAGREVHVLDPVFADLDVEVTVCVEPQAYAGDVEERVRAALLGPGPAAGAGGFFDPDRFTFGDPLDRSALEAAIQRVPGVRATEGIRLRRRGWFGWRDLTELAYPLEGAEVLRVANDPLHPERGSLRLVMRGGA